MTVRASLSVSLPVYDPVGLKLQDPKLHAHRAVGECGVAGRQLQLSTVFDSAPTTPDCTDTAAPVRPNHRTRARPVYSSQVSEGAVRPEKIKCNMRRTLGFGLACMSIRKRSITRHNMLDLLAADACHVHLRETWTSHASLVHHQVVVHSLSLCEVMSNTSLYSAYSVTCTEVLLIAYLDEEGTKD